MSTSPFPNSQIVDISGKIGPLLIDVRDYGAIADSVEGTPGTDNTANIQKALNDLASNIGGGTLYIPPSLKSFGMLDVDVPSNVYIGGRGIQSSLVRIGNLSSATRGLLNFSGSFSGVNNVALYGNVLTSAPTLYSAFSGMAMNSLLTQNSMIWVHSGATDIEFDGGWIIHTGGYAGVMDASTANVSRVKWRNWVFRNNRPHAFGTSGGDLTYGSWTGGLLYYGDCNTSLFAVDSFSVSGCKFYRAAGNCIWGDSLGFNIHHTNIDITDNYFEDFGLDAIELGNTRGFKVSGNRGRRGGYMTTSDTSTPNPKYLTGLSATFIDNSGYVEDGYYSDNGILSINGEGMDMDGCRNVSISGFSATIPLSGSPEYTSDSISLYGPGQNGIPTGRGIQTGDTSENGGAVGISINDVHLNNFGFSSILLAYAKHCTVSDVYINQQVVTGGEVPIQIFSSSAGSPTGEWLCNGNIIEDCYIEYTGSNYCIAETGTGWTTAAINRIFNNECIGSGNLGEFQPANSGGVQISGSIQGFSITGATSAAASVKVHLTAGTGQVGPVQTVDGGTVGLSSTAAINWATATPYSTGTVDLQLVRVSPGVLGVTTGGASYADIILRYLNAQGTVFNAIESAGGVYAASVTLGITNDGPYFSKSTATPPTETTTTYGAILHKSGNVWSYYNPSTTSWATIDFSASGGSVVGSDKQVIYNKGGTAYFADGNNIWDYTAQLLTVTAASSSVAGIYCKTGFIDSDIGYYSPGTSSSTVNIPSGGVTALSLISVRNDGVSGVTVARTTSIARDYGFAVSSSGALLLNDDTASAVRLTMNTSGEFTFGSTLNIDQSGNLSFTGTISGSGTSSGINVGGTASNAIQVPAGGVTALSLVSIRNDGLSGVSIARTSATTRTYGLAVSSGGSLLLNDDTASAIRMSMTTAGLFTFGSTLNIDQSGNLSFTGTIIGSGTSSGINVGGTASNSIQVPAGGVTALSLVSIRNDGLSGVSIARTSATARTYGFGVSSGGSLLLNDDTTSALRLSLSTVGTFTFGSTVNIDQSGNFTFTGLTTGVGSSSAISVQGTAFNAIQTTAGGIYCAATVFGVTNDGPYFSKTTASPPTETTTTYGALLHKSGTQWSYYNPSTTSWATVDFAAAGGSGTVASSSVGQVAVYTGATTVTGGINFTFVSQVLTVTAASSSVAGIVCATGFIQSTTGFYSPGTAYNVVNIPSGGGLFEQVTIGATIFDSSSGSYRTDKFQVQAADATMSMQATSASDYSGLLMLDNNGLEAASFQYANASAGFQPGNFFVAARTSGASLLFCSNGLNIRQTIASTGEVQINSGQITISASSSAITTTNGAIRYDSSTNLFQFRQNGAWVGLGGTGVTSLTASTGISVSASTGAVTITNIGVTSLGGSTGSLSLGAGTGVSISGLNISIGQAVATTSNVTFNQMTLNGAETIVGSGSSILFQTFNGSTTPIQMNGNGVISCLQFNVGGTTTINTSGAFVNSAGVAVTTGGIGGAAFGAWVSGSFYSFGIGTGASPTTVTIATTASLTVGAGLILAVTAVSDQRLKNILAPVTYGMDQIKRITPIHYTWNDKANQRMKAQSEHLSVDRDEHIGFIAQEFVEAMPKASFQGDDGYYGIDRDGLIAAMVVALKQVDTRLSALER